MEMKSASNGRFPYPSDIFCQDVGPAFPRESRSPDRQMLISPPDYQFLKTDRERPFFDSTHYCLSSGDCSCPELGTIYLHSHSKISGDNCLREIISGDRGSREERGTPDGWWYSRGYLPHHDGTVLIQHVTVHLADSLPQSAIERIDLSLRGLPEDRRLVERRKRLHEWIDAGHGSCVLRKPSVAEIVQNSLLHFHHVRYSLHAWVVMPNHFHVLFEPIGDWSVAGIVTSWKKFTARRIREYLKGIEEVNETGTSAGLETGVPGGLPLGVASRKRREHFWHREFWDRYIRDEEHYQDTVDYIHNNPVKAALSKSPEAWPWSSAGKK